VLAEAKKRMLMEDEMRYTSMHSWNQLFRGATPRKSFTVLLLTFYALLSSRRQNIKAEPGTGGTDGTVIKPQDGILDDAVVPPVVRLTRYRCEFVNGSNRCYCRQSASSTAPSTSSEVDALVRRMKMMRFGQLFSKNQGLSLSHTHPICSTVLTVS